MPASGTGQTTGMLLFIISLMFSGLIVGRPGGLILGVLGAALIVWLIDRSQQRRAY